MIAATLQMTPLVVAAALGRADVPPAPVFPPPPEPARIRYVRSIATLDSWHPRRGFLRRLAERVFGSGESPRVVRPLGVATCGDVLYVCDPGAACVHVLDGRDSSYVRIPHEGRIAVPVDAACDGRGRVFVSDAETATVTCYDEKGRALFRVEHDFGRPTGLAFDRDAQRLYVVDTTNHRIVACDPDGSNATTFGERGGEPGQFNFPVAIRRAGDGTLLVVDSMNFRIQRLSPEGRVLGVFGRPGDGAGDMARPKGVAADGLGHIYVVDALFDAVQVFDEAGRLLLGFGESGQGPAQFWLPAGIAIDGHDRIFVADSYNGRVQVFRYVGDDAGRAGDREQ